MDVNAIWAPHALESIGIIFDRLFQLGFTPELLTRASAESMRGTTLGTYARDRAGLRAAIATWSGAARHFLVTLSSSEARRDIDARLATMSPDARAFWSGKLGSSNGGPDSLAFLALALNADGSPIAVENSDPATRLFLGEHEGIANESTATAIPEILRDARVFARPYPLGLLIEGVGPVVANDAFAPAEVGLAFDRDAYHGPRVVWGREVNLFLLGAAQHLMRADSSLSSATRSPATEAYADELRAAIASVEREVERSGFRSELWSYEMRGGRPVPVRYGSGGDVQLWSTTDLVVQFTLAKLGR